MRPMKTEMNGAALFSGHIYTSYMYQKWQNYCRNVSACGSYFLMSYYLSQITYLNCIHLLHKS